MRKKEEEEEKNELKSTSLLGCHITYRTYHHFLLSPMSKTLKFFDIDAEREREREEEEEGESETD